jgi:sporulation-control protein spo0M
MNDHMMDSFVEIELFSEKAYYAGETINGNIHLFAKDNLNDVNKITLTLDGEESCIIYLKKKFEPLTKSNVVVSHIFTVYDYTDFYNCVQRGEYVFPFTLKLPECLPQSHLCWTTEENPEQPQGTNGKFGRVNQTKINYTLTARVEGTKKYLVENLMHIERMTVLIADLVPPLTN